MGLSLEELEEQLSGDVKCTTNSAVITTDPANYNPSNPAVDNTVTLTCSSKVDDTDEIIINNNNININHSGHKDQVGTCKSNIYSSIARESSGHGAASGDYHVLE